MTDENDYSIDFKRAANALLVLANAKRFHLIRLIAENEVDVGTLAKRVILSQSAVSQHLGKLRALKLVHTRRDRQTIYYSASDEARELVRVIDKAMDFVKT